MGIYSDAIKTYRNNTNSASTLSLIYPEKFLRYVFQAKISSTSNDDDTVGLVAAYTTDKDGFQYILTVCRSCGDAVGQPVDNTYSVIYNNQVTGDENKRVKIFVNNSSKCKWGNGGWGQTNTEAGYTANFNNGWNKNSPVIIKIIRDGDNLTIYTSQLGSTTLDPSTKISIDLNSDPILAKFKSACNVGFVVASQQYTSWSDISLFNLNTFIVDIRDYKFYKLNDNTEWEYDPTLNIDNTFGIGRLVYDDIQGKLYFTYDGYLKQIVLQG